MAQKLPPPYLDGVVPAQAGNSLLIPFMMNRAVGINHVYKIGMRIKTIASNKIVGYITTTEFSRAVGEAFYQATFDLTKSKPPIELTPGQFYKIQLVFYDMEETVGFYSSVGVFKYTSQPLLSIETLADGESGNLYTYTGVYENADSTEKVYSYRFTVEQKTTKKIIADSGVLIHDSTTDKEVNSSSDTWILNQQLTPGIIYSINYSVTTINNYTISKSYDITNNEIEDDLLESCSMEAVLDFDNGLINVKVNSDGPIAGAGGFVLSRADSKDGYTTWKDIMTFNLADGTTLPNNLWTDYTVEQGISYKYGLQRFNSSGFHSARIMNEKPVVADFEDIFLYDGFRQLKVRFNPKVTSIKNTILESKMDTIGGKYPFIFRNGDVCYKEFPISGLISYLSDPDELFMSNMELGFSEEDAQGNTVVYDETVGPVGRSTQVDTINISAERKFKMAVLDWLTNGQPKLFRSPAEGNYIVRLMNTSLSPNDTLSRMIHTFSSTAYEIAENNFENLVKYKFIQDITINSDTLIISSLDLNYNTIPYNNLIEEYKNGVYSARFVNVPSGTIFALQFLNRAGVIEIRIPNNRYYNVNIFNEPLISIKLKSLPAGINKLSGILDVGYYSKISVGDFGKIRRVSITDQGFQEIGRSGNGIVIDTIDYLTNIKYSLGHFYYLRVENKEITPVYFNTTDGYYYSDEDCHHLVTPDPKCLYEIQNAGSEPKKYFTGKDPGRPFVYPNYTMIIEINDNPRESIVIGAHNQAGYYVLPSVEKVKYLSIGNGLNADFMCQRKETIYCVEEDDPAVVVQYQQWKLGAIDDDTYFKTLAKHGIKE